MHKQKGLWKKQEGLVSLTVTIIIMIIVTLIVSSFALIVRREQKRALDRQLSAQAFYAAETGVEDAIEAISYPEPSPPNPSNRLKDNVTDCTGPDSFFSKTSSLQYNPVISENIEYTCVLVDQDIEVWNTASVNPEDGSFVVPVKVDPTGDTISKIRVSWQDKDNNNNGGNFQTNFPALPQAGMPVPMLRVTVLPGFNGGSLSRADFEAGMHTMFLYPQVGAPNSHGNITYVAGGPDHDSQGAFAVGQCSANHTDSQLPLHCNVDIGGGAMASIPRHEYFVHIQPLYQSASVSVQALSGTDANLSLVDSQAIIDVTGKAADVLRRIQVRVPIGDGEAVRNLSGLLPPGALVTEEAICKKWLLTSTTAEDLCIGTPWSGTVILLNTPPAPIGVGAIGACSDPTNPLCSNYTGPGGGGPQYEFQKVIQNQTIVNPPLVLTGCRWNWGNGYYTDFPPSASECQGNDTFVYHNYADQPVNGSLMQPTIESTMGAQGCYSFDVTLTNYFDNGVAPYTTPPYTVYVPGGTVASDPAGYCYHNHAHYGHTGPLQPWP